MEIIFCCENKTKHDVNGYTNKNIKADIQY